MEPQQLAFTVFKYMSIDIRAYDREIELIAISIEPEYWILVMYKIDWRREGRGPKIVL